MQVEARLSELGITLPDAPAPLANYVGAVQSGNHVFLSGAGPRTEAGYIHQGKLGQDVTTEQGAEAARICGLNFLANLKAVIGVAQLPLSFPVEIEMVVEVS